MTQLVAKYALKKVMGKELEKYKKKDAAGPYVCINSCFNQLNPS